MLIYILNLIVQLLIIFWMFLIHRENKKINAMVHDFGIDLKAYDQLKLLQKAQKSNNTNLGSKVGQWKK